MLNEKYHLHKNYDTLLNKWYDVGCLKNRIGSITISRIIDFQKYKQEHPTKGRNDSEILNSIFNEIEERNKLRSKDNISYEIVYLPEGVYTLTVPIKLSSYTILKGDGTQFSNKETKLLFDYTDRSNELWKSNYNIQIYNVLRAGIEDITIDQTGFQDDHRDGHDCIQIHSSRECWIRSIYSHNPISSHVEIAGSNNIEIRDSYFDDCVFAGAGGNGYGILLGGSAKYCLVENNIFKKLRHSMIFADESQFNAVAYNYSLERKNDEYGGVVNLSDICFHGAQAGGHGPSFNLAEGNIVEWICFDLAHGLNGRANIILNNRVSDDLTIQYNILTDEYQPDQIFVENYSDQGVVDGWDIESGDWFESNNNLIDGRNNKFKDGNWRIEHDDDCNIKTILYDIDCAPEFMNSFTWPFISWDYATTNIAMSRYNSLYPVGRCGFRIYKYVNLELVHDNLIGEFYSTGTINVNNSTVKSGDNLLLESNSYIIIKPETKIENGAQVNLKIR